MTTETKKPAATKYVKPTDADREKLKAKHATEAAMLDRIHRLEHDAKASKAAHKRMREALLDAAQKLDGDDRSQAAVAEALGLTLDELRAELAKG